MSDCFRLPISRKGANLRRCLFFGIDGHKVRLPWSGFVRTRNGTNVVRAWPNQLIICILFDGVSNPTHGSAQSEQGHRGVRRQLECSCRHSQPEIQNLDVSLVRFHGSETEIELAKRLMYVAYRVTGEEKLGGERLAWLRNQLGRSGRNQWRWSTLVRKVH